MKAESLYRTSLFTLGYEFTPSTNMFVTHVNQKQITELNLPTRPTKTGSTHARRWTGGESVELDSMTPADIKSLVEDCITKHISTHEWEMMKRTERMERATLTAWRGEKGENSNVR